MLAPDGVPEAKGAMDAVLGGCTDDTLLAVAVALPSLTDLLRFVRTSRASAQRLYFTATSYGSSSSAVPVPSGGASAPAAAAAAQAPDTWSIAEEVARRWIASGTDQERGWVPRRGRESWLGLMWEVQSLRRAAVFGRSHESITLSEGGSRARVRQVGNCMMFHRIACSCKQSSDACRSSLCAVHGRIW